MNASLVMQDFETDSYWAIMRGESIAGEFKGTKLKELPFGKKAMWKDWVKEHPNTVVLSVNGREDGPDGYQRYFSSPKQIAAISQPQFVLADSANIADDSWVLGVVIDGQARAYSLNLLNSHEVVNDRIGNTAFAAVW